MKISRISGISIVCWHIALTSPATIHVQALRTSFWSKCQWQLHTCRSRGMISLVNGKFHSDDNGTPPRIVTGSFDIDENVAWDMDLELRSKPYAYNLLESQPEWKNFIDTLRNGNCSRYLKDPLWEQVKHEATLALGIEPEAGPQLYQGILSQRSLLEALITTVAHEIENELIPAPLLKILFLEMLTTEDEIAIHRDILAVAIKYPNIENAMTATLFHRGLHSLLCYRVGHRLWLAGRTGLAYYLQSTVSRSFSADIHPAACIGSGIFLNCGGGVVIGETAVIGEDVSILQGVTLGGTGKEVGNRHPKVGNGVIIDDGAILLGNIKIGDGAVITAKSIVTKPVPPLAKVSGVPAKITSYRDLTEEEFDKEDWEQHLRMKYLSQWEILLSEK
jgi:serine O-acetyltransferase